MSADNFETTSLLKKFKKHFIIIGAIILLVILIAVYSSNPKEDVTPIKPVVSETFSAFRPSTVTPTEVMTKHLTEFENEQQKINQQNSNKISMLESQNAEYKTEAMQAESNANIVNQKLATLNSIKESSSIAAKPVYKPQKVVIEDDSGSEFSDNSAASAPVSTVSSNYSNNSSKSDEPKTISTYIPSNTFVKGVLIGGLSANTGGNAQSSPTPVLINLTGLAQLPNRFRFNVRSCMVGGSGYGDLSTERVNITLTNLSCVLKSGQAIDIPVYGYVDGEDSKAGIRGVVVTHSGTLAAKASLAGFIQGIGQVGQAVGQTQSITPLGGVTTTVSPSQALYAGGGAGISQTGSTLSTYYLNMLKDISPAIEVSAGRHISIVFVKGVELKLPMNDDINSNEQLPLGN